MANLLSPGTLFAGKYGPVSLLSASPVSVLYPQSVLVYESNGSTAATLYTDQTKAASTGSNQITTDQYGTIQFFADPGVYVLSFVLGGVTTTKTVVVDAWYQDAAWNVVADTVSSSSGSTFSPVSGDSRTCDTTTGAATYTLPTAALGAHVGITCKTYVNSCTVTAASGDTISGPGVASGTTSITLNSAGAFVVLEADGTNWNIVAGDQDSGWVDFTLVNSWTSATNAGVRLIGNIARLRGLIVPGSADQFSTVDALFRPTQTVNLVSLQGSGASTNYISINTAGACSSNSTSSGNQFLDGLTYTVD